MKKYFLFLLFLIFFTDIDAQNYNLTFQGKYYDLSWQETEYELYKLSIKERKYKLVKKFNVYNRDVFTLLINRNGHARVWWWGDNLKIKKNKEFDFKKSDCITEKLGDVLVFLGLPDDFSTLNCITIGTSPSISLYEDGSVVFCYKEKGVDYKILSNITVDEVYKKLFSDSMAGKFWIER